MKFYNRKTELNILETHYKTIENGIILDVFMGRRRIGKTALIKKFIKNKKHLYFFVSRKPLNELLEEWSLIIRKKFPPTGKFTNLDEFLEFIFALGKKQKLVIIFDEFQNFHYIYPPAFSVFQKFYDQALFDQKHKILLLLLGSITTLMEKIFTSTKEPLFGRATRRINLRPLDFTTCSRMAKDLNFKKPKSIFDLYLIFNGIPGYYSMLEADILQGKSLETILKTLILEPEAILRNEGEFLIREAFGKEYERYFKVLSLIARGKTKPTEIASSMELPVNTINTYLYRLENRFQFIERRSPMFAKIGSKRGRYYLKDIFLTFWFRFLYPYLSWIEKGEISPLLQIVQRDLSVYQGMIFENIARDMIFKKSHQEKDFLFPIIQIGGWWDQKGENEVDVAAIDENKQKIFLGECKINPARITKQIIDNLIEKTKLEIFKKFKKQYLGIITFGKLSKQQQKQLQAKNILGVNIEELLFA